MPKKRQPSAPSVWVVEREHRGRWSVIDAFFTRSEGRWGLTAWSRDSGNDAPGSKYRLTRYVSTRADRGKK